MMQNLDGTRNIPVGRTVLIKAHRSEPGRGLNYSDQLVELQDPCQTYGWDVLDCLDANGKELSVYSFSVADFICDSCDDQGCGFCVPCEPHGQ